jgi:uncharacterized protein YidB (DUF937 family)
MSLLDNLGGMLGDIMSGKQVDLLGLAQQALAGQGGLNGILGQLQSAGLGDQVSSWIGTGSNLPISAEQIQSALNNEQLTTLAASFGIDVSQVSNMLAQQLPQAVDQASPNGALEV